MSETTRFNLGVAYQFGDQPSDLILPQEILNMINEYIVGGRPGKPNYFGRVPGHLCLVNSTWRRIFTPALYANFRFTGNVNDLPSLWGFVRTLYQNPELGSLVKELTLTTWDIHAPFTLEAKDIDAFSTLLNAHGGIPDGQCIDDFRTNLALVMGMHAHLPNSNSVLEQLNTMLKERYATALYAQNQAWFDSIFELIIGSPVMLPAAQRTLQPGTLTSGYQVPLAIVAIALCPNLTRLNYNVTHSGQCIFFERILAFATGSLALPDAYLNRPPLGNLEVFNIGGQPVGSNGGHVRVMVSECMPYWQIPSLKTLSILNADEISFPLINPTQRFSAVEHLSIQCSSNVTHLPSLFEQMPKLSKLSLQLGVQYSYATDNDDADPTGPAQWVGIWRMLYHLKDRLEYLDLRQDAIVFSEASDPTAPYFHTQRADGTPLEPFCPPLHEFANLRHLHIPILGLAGHNCDLAGEHGAKLKFASHLPPSVESLGIYGASEPWVQFYFPTLDKELEGVMASGSGAGEDRHLRAFVYDGISATNRRHHELIERVGAAAARAGILFLHSGEEYLLRGGEVSAWGLLNTRVEMDWIGELLGQLDIGRVVPRGIEVGGWRGRLGR
ncbi:uncharacterized protein DSM5745_04125 [Aspergillus mulundensis]|uniref:F-box domain-containing protein n=1 Tax=Aspergillus mulundensis TaxID=1810919 RepID=A0A3D8SBS2_9EURO|nr:hypothetical protein DSM5745_04125 [Aspergillus mulundensis]RDW83799.1 hypothetical protein DSM5745_04125 [Aspergillus mulundensis]